MADINNPIPPGEPPPPGAIAPGNPAPPGHPAPPGPPDRPTEIVLNPRSVPRHAPPAAPKPAAASDKATETKDSLREVIETVVFVVVLVLLLKTFLAEAFVIPTGSMATTLLGYNIDVTCQKCGYTFPVNASRQEDPPADQAPQQVVGCTCPNCEFFNRLVPGGPPR